MIALFSVVFISHSANALHKKAKCDLDHNVTYNHCTSSCASGNDKGYSKHKVDLGRFMCVPSVSSSTDYAWCLTNEDWDTCGSSNPEACDWDTPILNRPSFRLNQDFCKWDD